MKEKRSRAILLVDHGSRFREANDQLSAVAKLVQNAAPDYHVEVAHMELAEPSIAVGIATCVASGAEDITVHPYMLSPGRHATRDIPRLVSAAAENHPGIRCRVTKPLGEHALLAQVVLERVRQATTDDGALDDGGDTVLKGSES